MKNCIYCNGESGAKLSREHLLSSCIQKEIYPDMDTYTYSTSYKNLFHKNIEATIKDVCQDCNSKLSVYDDEGLKWVREIDQHYDPSGIELSFNPLSFTWLLKTHLNYIRTFPNQKTKEFYIISKELYNSIISKNLNHNLFSFYLLGRIGKPFYWHPRETGIISFFDFRTFDILKYKLLFSYFRIKTIETVIFLPSDNNYIDFNMRVQSVIKKIKPSLQYVLLSKAFNKQHIKIRKVQPMNRYYSGFIPNQTFFDQA